MSHLTIHPATGTGPRYDGDDHKRMEEVVAAARERLPAALGAALALPFTERRAAARAALATLTERGDDLQYGSGDGVDALAQIVATLAIQPGGVTVLGHHWCLDHVLCEAVREAA